MEALEFALALQIGSPVVVGKVIPVPGWPSLGRGGVDLAVVSGPSQYSALVEAKWCHSGTDKIYEAIWDLFKVALVERMPTVRTAYLVTGAPAGMWPSALCADLFEGGSFTPEELCTRRFPRGGRRTAWDYLLEGGYDRYPDRVPSAIITTPIADPVDVAVADQRWVLRAVTVAGVGTQPDVLFRDGWPHGDRPSDARRPAVGLGP